MSGQQEPRSNPAQGPGERRRQNARDGRNIFQAGGNNNVRDSILVGGDATITVNRIKKWALANPLTATGAGLAVVVCLVWGGSAVVGAEGSAVDTSVVSEAGLTGARHTMEQIRVAERVADPAAWCDLVQPGDSDCARYMSSAFGAKSDTYRKQTGDIGLGEPEKTATGARTRLSWQGKNQGYVDLTWTGGRWQLASSEYGLLKLCKTGVFLSLVDARNGQAKCGPFSLPPG
ncbi:hypothetical protein KUM39_10320 [Streptomyces sp. J2-1]|uniref:hypothetical protein n=1 Tax=Streptomyces corallincola TaxID=2851888 RepID=UPI001C37F268|nr:hypothetical protein [Streptomyces corallincola]MBV2354755.1 hypothetical protein [Streptomyces corallincola]